MEEKGVTVIVESERRNSVRRGKTATRHEDGEEKKVIVESEWRNLLRKGQSHRGTKWEDRRKGNQIAARTGRQENW